MPSPSSGSAAQPGAPEATDPLAAIISLLHPQTVLSKVVSGAGQWSARYGGKSTAEIDVARAVWLAATDGSSRLRYAAGVDAEELAAMRRALPGEDYLAPTRAAIGPNAPA
jgi:hypothetical protein